MRTGSFKKGNSLCFVRYQMIEILVKNFLNKKIVFNKYFHARFLTFGEWLPIAFFLRTLFSSGFLTSNLWLRCTLAASVWQNMPSNGPLSVKDTAFLERNLSKWHRMSTALHRTPGCSSTCSMLLELEDEINNSLMTTCK